MTERKLVPKIRFKRFEEEWLKTDFGKIVFRNSATTDSKELRSVEYENINSEYGTVTKSYNNKKGIKFKKGDVLFGKLRPYLKNWILTCFEGKAVGDFWVLSSRKGFDSSFVFYLIQTNRFAFISNITTGTKMPRSDWNLVSNTSFDIPIRSEQQKIGALFAKLDQLLDLQHQKLDQLELLKKALLQKLFPKQDAKIPELRFKGFAKEWKKDTIGEIARTKSGGTPSVNNKKYYDGNIPFIRSSDINKTNVDLKINDDAISNSAAFIVKKGNILYALYGATSGQVAISRITGAVNQAVLAIFPKQYMNKKFLVYWFSYNKEKITTKYLQGGQGNLSAKIIKKLLIRFPLKDEQQKIGNLLAKIDRLIELENKKFSNLKLVKKSLLQNMFVE